MTTKSPFLIIQDFVSPLLCEQIVDGLDFVEPDLNDQNKPVLTSKPNESFEKILYQYTQNIKPQLETYYNMDYRGMKPVNFKWYPEDCAADEGFTCENAFYNKSKKWAKNKDRDLTCVLFLSDFNDDVPFESDYEVYGGKVEFPQHNFGFQAERGTLVVYPSGPHFLNQVQGVAAGDLFMAKWHIASQSPFLYDPKQFPGDMISWFETFA